MSGSKTWSSEGLWLPAFPFPMGDQESVSCVLEELVITEVREKMDSEGVFYCQSREHVFSNKLQQLPFGLTDPPECVYVCFPPPTFSRWSLLEQKCHLF